MKEVDPDSLLLTVMDVGLIDLIDDDESAEQCHDPERNSVAKANVEQQRTKHEQVNKIQ